MSAYNILLLGKADEGDLSYYVNFLVASSAIRQAEAIALYEASSLEMKIISIEESEQVTYTDQALVEGIISVSGRVYFPDQNK